MVYFSAMKGILIEAAWWLAAAVGFLFVGFAVQAIFVIQPIIGAAWFDFLAWLLPPY